jgi:hypothetical protein
MTGGRRSMRFSCDKSRAQVRNTMADALTVKQVYDVLRQYARKRPDIGVAKALLDGALEPASPFESKGVRSPKRWFVLLSLLAVLMFACFVHFNRFW